MIHVLVIASAKLWADINFWFMGDLFLVSCFAAHWYVIWVLNRSDSASLLLILSVSLISVTDVMLALLAVGVKQKKTCWSYYFVCLSADTSYTKHRNSISEPQTGRERKTIQMKCNFISKEQEIFFQNVYPLGYRGGCVLDVPDLKCLLLIMCTAAQRGGHSFDCSLPVEPCCLTSNRRRQQKSLYVPQKYVDQQQSLMKRCWIQLSLIWNMFFVC